MADAVIILNAPEVAFINLPADDGILTTTTQVVDAGTGRGPVVER